MGFNKGEWSELYTFLYLLEKPELEIVNNDLQVVDNQTFKLLKLLLKEFTFENTNDKIKKIYLNNSSKEYLKTLVIENKDLLLNKITTQTASSGSFDIPELQSFIDDFFDGEKPKGASNVKGDLVAKVFDNKLVCPKQISYNIKSSLGSPATLLNASNNTNFIYEISGINDNIMNEVNSVNSKNKLLDRYNKLIQNNAGITFSKVQSSVFDFNLRLIDSNLSKILSEILLLSYSSNQKDIKLLLSNIATNSDEEFFYKKKLGDFANSVTFGMRAGSKWNTINEVNGGILLVCTNGNIYLLDLIYNKNYVDKYLIDNIKLDSPSSSRYKMFEIYKENQKYYTKLNLQIRFKN
jgi:hypothetical protein